MMPRYHRRKDLLTKPQMPLYGPMTDRSPCSIMTTVKICREEGKSSGCSKAARSSKIPG